ncbi:Cloroperoxidase [Stereum hirsutum FP-91666 SS1]|uniref:Cloroperoxidase n=1 Tax=Stereum hirsutum (strain FP-91666) TaxID=721885 RepID=UPI000440DBD5|nr:Cloroperoxidase [Stereum hirsutum FP-91666 SS1]EIM88703.1 Cloroperoxidase [Stereum hirsutum FP-91666 SS1]
MPGIVPHSHAEGTCPVTGATSHAYCAPQPDDKRAPCPALNTLANHGYLPRDGKQIDAAVLIRALEEGYDISAPLAYVLAYGGHFLLGQFGPFQLDDLARHNKIEHNASLIHPDARGRDEYAPIHSDPVLWKELVKNASDGKKLTTADVAEARVRRETDEMKAGKEALDGFHAEIARGEMAIALGMFSKDGEDGIPMGTLKQWMLEERLPEGWKPTHIQGLLNTVAKAREIKGAMEKIRASEDAKEKAGESHLKLVQNFKL